MPGTSLAKSLEVKGPLAPPAAVGIVDRLLEALDHVNAKGVARLDLRPASIMLDDDLTPTITKLGLAKHVEAGANEGGTQAGAVVGTPAYAPPEQLRGEPVDIRADLYSLTLILFEMIAGRLARDADLLGSILHSAGASVDLDALPVSDDLRYAISVALDPDPARRFATPAEMIAALAQTPEGADARETRTV